MTDADLDILEAMLYNSVSLKRSDEKALIDEVRNQKLQLDQQARWLREVTQERDALKIQVAELSRDLVAVTQMRNELLQ